MLNFYLPNKLEGEKIIIILRRHWFIIFTKIIFWAFVALLPLIFYLLMINVLSGLIANEVIYPIFVLFTSIYYLYVWLFIFYSFVDYYLDVWILTNARIVNTEQKGLLSRTVSEQRLYRIQDVTSELKGFFSTILDFGTVYVQTAAEEPRFVFKQVPHPQQVAKKIIKIVEQDKKFRKIMEEKDKVTAR